MAEYFLKTKFENHTKIFTLEAKKSLGFSNAVKSSKKLKKCSVAKGRETIFFFWSLFSNFCFFSNNHIIGLHAQ